MQSDWLDILTKYKYPSGLDDYYKMQALLKQLGAQSIGIAETGLAAALQHEENSKWIYPKYRANIHIPAMQGTLKTSEARLGAYAVFVDKTVGTIYAQNVNYLGQRELEYNAEGGKIKNIERMGCEECCFLPPKVVITVDYAISGPFVFAYKANWGADFYAYFIADPTRDLENKFDSLQAYKSRAMSGTMFSKSEKSETAMVPAPSLK